MNSALPPALATVHTDPPPPKRSFRLQMQQARQDAIVSAVNRLLAEKGFDAMTVDEVAAEVGIAKASLYRHFPSKEELAAAAMVKVMQRAEDFLRGIDLGLSALQRLMRVARWMMEVQVRGEMPALPSENSTLRAALAVNRDYTRLLMVISDLLGRWIEQAQADGDIEATLPPIVVLYTLYARACDPVLGFLKGTGQFSDEELIEQVMRTCFMGLRSR
jgi:TetR/AcrR family transcriptional regulator, regulator of autoinduction and epiphytic fitness